MKKIPVLFLFFVMFAPFCSFSQDLNIDGDTIKISSEVYPNLRFPEEIQQASTLCASDNYRLSFNGSRITIKPGTAKPLSPCQLSIDEGTEKKQRNHRFILIFTDPGETFEPYHDLHTTDLIQQRITYLENSKKKAAEIAEKAKPVPAPEVFKKKETIATNDSIFVLDGGKTILKRSDLESRIGAKTERLTKCLELLCRKKENYQSAIDYGMKLFNNDETRTVAVSSKKTGVNDVRPIRKYLVKMSQIQYERVEIKWRQGIFIGNIQKQEDGTYRGVVTIEQEFSGYNGSEAHYAYHDVMEKNLEIVIKVWDVMENGKEKTFMDVFLGNIGLSESVK